MVSSVILGMLCLHLFCFCLMFRLISARLHCKKKVHRGIAWSRA
ncbi:putative membrane protein [Bordetella holmesii 30539]|uniref:Uncharacterized protein n=2 Tax=Bordetella holmesii TaxID=35814 RepID=A0A158M7N9_9BORD|nr:putative membrane protein [Bordetella holmesii ATCC 51541]AIT26969.1 putative membrane protein [Bordetella holmesii 44057]EWM42962.1 putative membrane protein [Bordetella holmesii 41130]EWM47553.1 putative membrane protein [Bordetella holmesii 35009]EWM51721.1 putative membrane protein [Bordetella holmesii 70147]EXF88952.1 putative membrane protein [Bordetella holmesii 30539]EXX93034.1 putative membrane protein [Bordetella holmesii 1058]KAK79500.1 hypothetical protein L503_0165 [Bordetell